jgi:lipopolysaccharide export system protein LptA
MRRLLVVLAALLVAVVAGYYIYGKYRAYQVVKKIPEKLGIEVQQSTSGFTFSKSEGGKTLFTISAGKAVQFKQGQRAELNDVRILVFTREEGSYDQIYGKRFTYDPEGGEVRAEGDVMIDLGAKGKPEVEVSQTAPGAIHLKTSGLSFNRQTGIARTDERIEFSFPQASGSAQGAIYDSRSTSLTLQSDVRIHTQPTTAGAASLQPAEIRATRAVISDRPRISVLDNVHADQPGRTVDAQRVKISLDLDNRVQNVTASGGISMSDKRTALRAANADLSFGNDNTLDFALLSGGVSMSAAGETPMQASAGKVRVDFAQHGRAKHLHAEENVQIARTVTSKPNAPPQTMEVRAPAMDLNLAGQNQIETALTRGPSQVIITSAPGAGKASRTTIFADTFTAQFAAKNRPRQIQGDGNVRVVTSATGEPDRITASRQLNVRFQPGGTEIASIAQSGDFTYSEGTRKGAAAAALYLPRQETIELTGGPRLEDSATHFSISADKIQLERQTGGAVAEGNVKATYAGLTASPGGAMLAASEPIHVTAQRAVAKRASDSARFSGEARLWQGANIVEAPVITFDRGKRSLEAISSANKREVRTVFVQTDRSGKQLPVNVTAARLTYSDQQRVARFLGGVQVSSPDATMRSAQVEIVLYPKGEETSGTGATASKVKQIVASGNVVVEQREPARRAVGERLTYTSSEEKFVLTGVPPVFASIFDAEHGKITGDSLTFYTRDDRVQVVSQGSTRTVTRTHSQDER